MPLTRTEYGPLTVKITRLSTNFHELDLSELKIMHKLLCTLVVKKPTTLKEFNVFMKDSGQTDQKLGNKIICKFTIVFKLFYAYWQHFIV